MIQSLEIWQWVAIAGILFLASFVQGAVGFAAGMISISLTLHIGIPMPESIVISLVASSAQSLGGVWDLRKDAGGQHLLIPIAMRLLFMPLGIFCLYWIDDQWQPARIKQLIGIVVIASICLLMLSKVSPRQVLPTGFTVATFSLSGLMQGSIGMAGPPIVLWLAILDWSNQKSRVFLFQVFLASIPFQATALLMTFPDRFFPALLVATLMLPAILLGSWMGLQLGNRFSKSTLRRLSLGLLMAIGVASIVQPFFS